MDTKTQARYKTRARIIKAMAHPTRLFVVDELFRHGEHCVCELTEMVGVDMSTVSRHLAILKGAGLIEDKKRGTQVYYRVRVGCIVNFLDCVESLVKCNARDQRELLDRTT
jgi:ArsR family transcriptional regulator